MSWMSRSPMPVLRKWLQTKMSRSCWKPQETLVALRTSDEVLGVERGLHGAAERLALALIERGGRLIWRSLFGDAGVVAQAHRLIVDGAHHRAIGERTQID